MEKINDLVGKTFNKLKVLEKVNERINGNIAWKCECICGNVRVVSSISLKRGFIKSCKLCKNKLNKKDVVGNKYNYLKVISEADHYI